MFYFFYDTNDLKKNFYLKNKCECNRRAGIKTEYLYSWNRRNGTNAERKGVG